MGPGMKYRSNALAAISEWITNPDPQGIGSKAAWTAATNTPAGIVPFGVFTGMVRPEMG